MHNRATEFQNLAAGELADVACYAIILKPTASHGG